MAQFSEVKEMGFLTTSLRRMTVEEALKGKAYVCELTAEEQMKECSLA